MTPDCTVTIVPWHGAEQPLLRHIRETVFVHEQGVPAELEWDDEDAEATHLLARAGEMAVGTARLLNDGHIGRVAVLPAWRRHGIATMLLQRCIALARERGLREVWLDAQTAAMPLYFRLGFVAEGDLFMDAGIPHRRMRLRW